MLSLASKGCNRPENELWPFHHRPRFSPRSSPSVPAAFPNSIPPNPTTPDVAETSRRSPHVVNPVAQKRETTRADSCNNVPLKMQRAFRVLARRVARMESIVVIINDWPWNALLVPLRYRTTPTAYPIIISPLSEY